jgi:hypothetical protein
MGMEKFGENFKPKQNHLIGLFGHILHLRDGVKELLVICRYEINY